jgi:hypothetical protein
MRFFKGRTLILTSLAKTRFSGQMERIHGDYLGAWYHSKVSIPPKRSLDASTNSHYPYREDVPWLLIDYLEENLVYGDHSNNECTEPTPKRRKKAHSVAANKGRGRGRLRKITSQSDIVMEDAQPAPAQPALGTEQGSSQITPSNTIKRGRGRPPKAQATIADESPRRSLVRPLRSNSNPQPAVPVEEPQSPAAVTEPEIEPESEPSLPQPISSLFVPESPRGRPPLSLPQSAASSLSQKSPVKRTRGRSKNSEMDVDSPAEKQPFRTREPVSPIPQPPSPPPDRIPSPFQHRLVAPIAPMGMGPFIS